MGYSTYRSFPLQPGIQFAASSPGMRICKLARQEGRDIWIPADAGISAPPLRQNGIGCYRISVISMLAGGGLLPFPKTGCVLPLCCAKVREENGIAERIYRPRRSTGA